MLKKLREIFTKKPKKDLQNKFEETSGFLKNYEVFNNLEKNISFVKVILSESEDVVYREVIIKNKKLILMYISGLVDRNIIETQILKPLMDRDQNIEEQKIDLRTIKEELITVADLKMGNCFYDLINALLSGETVLFFENESEALMIDSRGGEKRGIGEPFTEQGVSIPRDSFTETIQDNIALVRRRIKDPNLIVQFYILGKRTQTKTALMYLKDKVPVHIVKEIQKRIEKIDIENILSSSHVEQLIQNHKWSIFPQMVSTELPIVVIRGILDGRVAIIVEGSPYNLVIPGTLAMFFNSGDDYNGRAIATSLLRVTRYASFIIATTLPAAYVALTAYHPGMLPTSLVLYITGTRVGLPLPAAIEMLFMLFTLEILVEAAIRLPKPISQTVGIVGGLVIGQAAVQAGLVSPLVVIIIAFTAISSFVLPYFDFALVNRSLRVLLILGATTFGLLGIAISWILIIIHMASIETFGVRYLQDFFPFNKNKVKDTLLKAPYEFLLQKQEALQEEDKK